jgi:16S rRNA (guanine966-N2)-methyltransferase
MRVIAGEFRSRKLKSMPGLDIRPTPDRLRQALFNVLQTSIEGVLFVDAYAGTGSVGIEALSRGARRVVFIENSGAAVELIRQNLQSLGAVHRALVVRGKAAVLAPRYEGDIVFIDPPYPLEKEYDLALEALGETPSALVIVQHASRFSLKDEYGRFRRVRILRQGDNSLSFYSSDSTRDSGESDRMDDGPESQY